MSENRWHCKVARTLIEINRWGRERGVSVSMHVCVCECVCVSVCTTEWEIERKKKQTQIMTVLAFRRVPASTPFAAVMRPRSALLPSLHWGELCPTVKAALRHECADSVEDREGLGAIWSRAYCFEHHLKMAVPSNSALFESIGGNFGYSHGLPLSHCQVLFSAGVFKLWVASRRVGQDGSHKVTWLQLNLHFNDTHRSV